MKYSSKYLEIHYVNGWHKNDLSIADLHTLKILARHQLQI